MNETPPVSPESGSCCAMVEPRAVRGAGQRKAKARPFVPTEIHVGTVTDEADVIGVLSIHTTEGLVDIALDLQSADAMVSAIQEIRSKLEPTRTGVSSARKNAPRV